ncbi:glycosyltransferase family protein [Haloactinomyces albus]|uniref:Spore protein YkvP/CgeB glycosyl transferase-like domain-containing protein n=1 Tax=Haloactinomyces albus TaxID=1352928 RepID=A0AAE3ZHU1_9ACTN|nr:hypothetical protein [Haloactinomyces albus]MDR7303874.1 hypothetical protein [Haloactinomyces albus]
MRIGYSFWGFLGSGITNTPDGGRSHRRTLIDGLIAAGHEIVFLQANRDFTEADTDLRSTYFWDETGLPDIDLLFCEWRWPIPGRNTSPCGHPNHTCDRHRQQQLLEHYTHHGLPTLIWDKDQQLPRQDPWRTHPAVTVCEPALYPTPGAHSLLFPIADTVLDQVDPAQLVGGARTWPLVYVGNQYDRDAAFDAFFAPAAAQHAHQVAGKWTDTQRWPHVRFTGRVPFAEVEELYRDAVATVLLLPDRYAASGQMTQRLFEAVLAGCLPLAPTTIRGIEHYVPARLHISSGDEATKRVGQLRRASLAARAEILAACLRRLDLFRLSRQVTVLGTLMTATSRS